MPKISGTLTDFGLDPLAEFTPSLTFKPSGPAVAGAKLLVSKPVKVTPEYNGYFEVDLEATAELGIWYTVVVSWHPEGTRPVESDVLPWKLNVPDAGGLIGELIETPQNPYRAYVGPTEPENPTAGMWWLNTTTGELSEWS